MTASHQVLKDNGSIYVSCTYHNLAEMMTVLKRAVKGKNRVFNYEDLKNINPDKQKDGSSRSEFLLLVLVSAGGTSMTIQYRDLQIRRAQGLGVSSGHIEFCLALDFAPENTFLIPDITSGH